MSPEIESIWQDEKSLQDSIEQSFIEDGIEYERERNVPGIGRADFVVATHGPVVVEVKWPRRLVEFGRASGQARFYAAALGIDRAAVAIPESCGHHLGNAHLLRALVGLNVEVWMCCELFGRCDDIQHIDVRYRLEHLGDDE